MGERNPYILVDTGEGRDEYVPSLQEALTDSSRERATSEPYISDIILTHRHHDHTEGLPSVLALLRKLWDTQQPPPATAYRPPRIHKIPLPTPDPRLNALIDRPEALEADPLLVRRLRRLRASRQRQRSARRLGFEI